MAWFGQSSPDRNAQDAQAVARQSQRSRQLGGEAPRLGFVRSLLQYALLTPEQRAITTLPWSSGSPLTPASTSMETALTLGAVYAAVRILATNIASLPIKGYRQDGPKTTPLATLPQLFIRPSVQGTLWDWLHRLVTSMCMDGNAWGLVTAYDGYGYPIGVEWLHPTDVTVVDTVFQQGEPGSFTNPVIRWRGIILRPSELIHIPWFTVPFRVKGLSPLSAYAATVTAGLGALSYSSDWYANGGVPPGTFQNSAKTVNQNEANEVKSRLVSAIRSHQPIVYGNDWEYKPIAINPHEAQFIETMRMTANQIAAVYGVPPEKVGGDKGGSMTYANSEQESIDFVQFTLLSWVKKLEAAFFPLLPDRQYVKFNLDAMIRVDLRTRHDVYFIDRRMGLRNIDEIRELEDLPPLPNGEGKSYIPLTAAANDLGALPPNPTDVQPTSLPASGKAPAKPAARAMGDTQPPPVVVNNYVNVPERSILMENYVQPATAPAVTLLGDTINVQPAAVSIPVHVQPADVQVPVTVQGATVNVEPAAVSIPVNVEAARAPDVRVEAPITVNPPAVQVNPPSVIVQPAQVSVTLPAEAPSKGVDVVYGTDGKLKSITPRSKK